MTSRRARRSARTYAEAAQPGVMSWKSHADIERGVRRTKMLATGLGAMAALWLLGLTGDGGDNAGLGVVILEIFTLVPFLVTLLHLRGLNKLRRRMEERGAAQQQEDADELRHVDETLVHIARLTRALRGDVARTAGEESFASAERAAEEWRRLVERESELEVLLEATASDDARRSLQRSLASCREDAAGFRTQIEELAAALAELVDRSEEDPVDDDLHRLRAAGDRIEALAQGFAEVNALVEQQERSAPG